MKEGYILKFYREKEGLTQGQLAEGICSITHLSKIERGITEYSPEITKLLSERLNRDLQKEVGNYHRLSQRLKDWHEAMIMQRMEEADQLKIEIERDPMKEFPDFLLRYQLLLSRYELFNNKLEQAYNRLTDIQRQDLSQSPYDCHLVKHLLGIYYFLTSQFHLCIESLKAIDPAQYNNQEYYYHLALAYHSIHSNITSYYYAEKALSFFRKTLNMLRIIDTETLMLVELNSKELHDFEDTKQKYEILLKSCDTCYNSAERKSKLYNNYAFECFRRKKDQDAALLYEKAMSLLEKQNPFYLIALDGYLQACNRGKFLSRERMLELAREGLQLANKGKLTRKCIDFKMHICLIEENFVEYYQLIEKEALPYLRQSGEMIIIDHYEKKLFHYYLSRGKSADAFQLAKSMIESKKSYYDHS